MIGYKYITIQSEILGVLLFLKQWMQIPGTGSLSFPISSAKMPVTNSVISLKLLLLCV